MNNALKIIKGTTIASRDLGDIPVLVVTPTVAEDYKLSDTAKITSFERLFGHLQQMKVM